MDGGFGVSSNKGIRKRYWKKEIHPAQPSWERFRVGRACERFSPRPPPLRAVSAGSVRHWRGAGGRPQRTEPRPRSDTLVFLGRRQRCPCLQKPSPTATRAKAGSAEPLLASTGTGVAAGPGGERATSGIAGGRRQASGGFILFSSQWNEFSAYLHEPRLFWVICLLTVLCKC